ncbi:MAG: membrane protein insertion efficiency factor YidD [Flavobacteriales bacterium]
MRNVLSFLIRSLILFYKGAISPLTSPRCRFIPTCSEYGLQAIKKFGPYKGTWLTLKRIISCHPWGGHGHDPIP